jgi:hypothetical protein
MAASSGLSGSVCTLNSGRRLTADDVCLALIIASPLIQFFRAQALVPNGPRTEKNLAELYLAPSR